jgi:hypothetical protein
MSWTVNRATIVSIDEKKIDTYLAALPKWQRDNLAGFREAAPGREPGAGRLQLHGLALGLCRQVRNPVSGKYIRKYLHTKPNVDVEQRMRVYNLIRDLTADAYGGWHFVVALQAGGGNGGGKTEECASAQHADLSFRDVGL